MLSRRGRAVAEKLERLPHAAQLMRRFVQHPPAARRTRWPQFAPAAVGKRYRRRLEEIMAGILTT